MNAKGGVGKSTLVLALAETLSAFHSKRVLVVDSDAQASISHMLMPQQQLTALQDEGQTIVDYLIGAVLKQSSQNWRHFVIGGVSDVDDARSVDLLPSDTNLTLFEREVSKGEHEATLRRIIGACLRECHRDALAEAGIGAGDQRDLAFQAERIACHVISVCECRRAGGTQRWAWVDSRCFGYRCHSALRQNADRSSICVKTVASDGDPGVVHAQQPQLT